MKKLLQRILESVSSQEKVIDIYSQSSDSFEVHTFPIDDVKKGAQNPYSEDLLNEKY